MSVSADRAVAGATVGDHSEIGGVAVAVVGDTPPSTVYREWLVPVVMAIGLPAIPSAVVVLSGNSGVETQIAVLVERPRQIHHENVAEAPRDHRLPGGVYRRK